MMKVVRMEMLEGQLFLLMFKKSRDLNRRTALAGSRSPSQATELTMPWWSQRATWRASPNGEWWLGQVRRFALKKGFFDRPSWPI